MPDDASGNYSLPSGYLAVTGQVVQPSNHNPPLEDLAAATTARLPRSGVAPMTGPLKTVTGSASAPAISPNNNPAIGLYWTATGIAFAGSVAGVRFIGELIPYTLLTAPALTVLPYGQTLLRASYPDLWALAQTDIAAGNTFYNNGNGSTTFGIGDLRDRVVAGWGKMGGTDVGLLTADVSGVDGKTLGAKGGVQGRTINKSNLPNVTFTFSGTPATITVNSPSANVVQGAASSSLLVGTGGEGPFRMLSSTTTSNTLSSSGSYTPGGTVSSGGSDAVFPTTQPTLVCNYLLYAGA